MTLKILQWTFHNKLIVLLGLLTFCFFISTLALSTQNRTANGLCVKQLQENFNNMSYKKVAPPKEINKEYYRLPRHTKPENYELFLEPHTTNKIFNGTVKIMLNILKSTKSITLHSNKLMIISTALSNREERFKIMSTELLSNNREFLRINLQNYVPKGKYQLLISFSGKLEGIIGFYASSLKSGRTMVASKFQPTYARQAFPCFDEPDFKATYDITLVKPLSYVALSNMNEISKKYDEHTQTEAVTFATSVPMSTYLACFVICDFTFKETEINSNGIGNNFKLRSFAQKDQMHKIDFAQDIGKRATEFYVKYYEVPFPLPKLDMIAIPDYVSGATEHWGLITYRETSFLVDQSTASAQNKISVANTIAHELAHMWFGNLVTIKWWDDLWLNEGFASYMQVKALNAIEPSWTMLDQFLTKTLHSVLVTDAKLSSHPIVQTVATPDQITAIFDAISYNKGASILRMLEGFIGEENFRRGVSDYLKKFEFGNTVTQDLLASLEPYFKKDNSNLNLTHIMDTWTRQMGYPLLTVKQSEDNKSYVITQSRFLLDPEAVYNNDSPYSYRWFIPITYKTNKGEKKKIIWFFDTKDNVLITLEDGETWMKLNNNQIGYYRVNYELDLWMKLIDQLKRKSEQLTISDRAHLINEVFALAEARAVSYDVALNLSTYLVVEEDYVPWDTAYSVLVNLDNKLLNSPIHEKLQKYIQHLVKPLYAKQSWERSDTSVIQSLLRTKILSLAARCHLPDADNKVKVLFLNWLNNHGVASSADIEPDLRDVIYYYGMKSATQSEWEKLWQIYLKEEDAQEQAKLRVALAAPRDAEILRRYLVLAWDEKNIRSQDYLNVLHHISSNPSGTALVWDEVRSRWEQLVERFTLNSRYLGNMIPAVTHSFKTDVQLKEMEEFFAKYPDAGAGEAARRRALENIRNNMKWAATHLNSVSSWLQAHQF